MKPLLLLWGYRSGWVVSEVGWEMSWAPLEEYLGLQHLERASRAGQEGGTSHCWKATGENMIEVVTLNLHFRNWDFSKLRSDLKDQQAWVERQAFR
jgi:hypothetical protein